VNNQYIFFSRYVGIQAEKSLFSQGKLLLIFLGPLDTIPLGISTKQTFLPTVLGMMLLPTGKLWTWPLWVWLLT